MISNRFRRFPRPARGAVAGAIAVVGLAGLVGASRVSEIDRLGPPPGPSPVSSAVAEWPNQAASTADTVSFANDILPIFRQRCAKCHGDTDENGDVRTEASLNLLEYEKVMAGSEFGTVIEAGDPEGSFLLDMIVAGDMPEEGDPVPEEEIAVIRAWIEAGAPNN